MKNYASTWAKQRSEYCYNNEIVIFPKLIFEFFQFNWLKKFWSFSKYIHFWWYWFCGRSALVYAVLRKKKSLPEVEKTRKKYLDIRWQEMTFCRRLAGLQKAISLLRRRMPIDLKTPAPISSFRLKCTNNHSEFNFFFEKWDIWNRIKKVYISGLFFADF